MSHFPWYDCYRHIENGSTLQTLRHRSLKASRPCQRNPGWKKLSDVKQEGDGLGEKKAITHLISFQLKVLPFFQYFQPSYWMLMAMISSRQNKIPNLFLVWPAGCSKCRCCCLMWDTWSWGTSPRWRATGTCCPSPSLRCSVPWSYSIIIMRICHECRTLLLPVKVVQSSARTVWRANIWGGCVIITE